MAGGVSWRDDALPQRFAELDDWLARHRRWWQPRAFQQLRLPWENAHPALSQRLRTLTPATVEALSHDGAALAALLAPFIEQAERGPELCALPPFEPAADLVSWAEPYGVPGRKWRQTQAFAQCLPAGDLPLLEWCAGKAHLARALARERGLRADALEWNAALVEEGNALSQREALPVTLHHVDVLADAARDYLRREQQVVALHACGDLHVRLLQYCGDRGPRALALVPCCYHLTECVHYAPLSAAARRSTLALGRDDLRTAVQETVTAPARVREQRGALQAWRLGFDLLQRDVRGVDEYLPSPSLPPSVLREGFAAFCARQAQRAGIDLPAGIDYAQYARRGEQRLREVAALDLVRLLFRRPLELWLVLDRALLLRERGYRVEVGEFCAAQLTPRNILIRAHRTA